MQSVALDQLKKFIVENNIVGTSAGVCIALAVKDGIQSMVGDIIIPGLLILARGLHIDFLKNYLPENGKTNLDVSAFIKQMITFILVVIVSFAFVKLSFEYLLNIKSPSISDKTKEKNEKKPVPNIENFYSDYY
jgi:large-conductance mechanosensitive channel